MTIRNYARTPDRIRAVASLSRKETQEKLAAIHRVIPYFVQNCKESRIRRDVLHKEVCKVLKLTKSNAHIYLIKSVLKAQGIHEIMSTGVRSYGIRRRDTQAFRRQRQSLSQKS